jgi:5'-nucleotidase
MRVLLSNDDGISADGLEALAEAAAELGEVVVVAPDREQSATSHAISLTRPLRIKKVQPNWYAVDGTPTDCAFLAINHLLKDARPDVLISGINRGANLGDDVTYSGTVAAAMEGTLLGVPSLAVSLIRRDQHEYSHAAAFARDLARVVAKAALPRGTLLNVNVPPGPIKGYAVTRLGKHSYGTEVIEKTDPRGRRYYWIGGDEAQHEDIPGSDCNVTIDQGLVSITPLHLDLTHTSMIDEVKSWKIGSFARAEER